MVTNTHSLLTGFFSSVERRLEISGARAVVVNALGRSVQEGVVLAQATKVAALTAARIGIADANRGASYCSIGTPVVSFKAV